MIGLLRSELRKMFSTRLWWGLLIPIVALSVLVNLSGALLAGAVNAVAAAGGRFPVLIVSLAYSLVLTSLFAVALGIVSAAGEFRHRTITSTYLTAKGRGPVLVAKMVVAAAIGALYAGAAVSAGVLADMGGQIGHPFSEVGTLAAVGGIGIAVCALWGAFGAALGTLISNQVGALGLALGYLLVGELLVSALLVDTAAETVGSYLPGNASDIALYDLPARVVAGPGFAELAVRMLVGVVSPPPWWVGLLVLGAWTAVLGVAARVVAARRDVT